MVPWFPKSEVCCLNQLKPWIPSMHHSHFFHWAVHNFDWAYSLIWNGYILQKPLHLRKCISFCGTWPVHVIGRPVYLNSCMIFIQHVWTKYHLWHQLKLFTQLAWSPLNEVLTSAIVSTIIYCAGGEASYTYGLNNQHLCNQTVWTYQGKRLIRTSQTTMRLWVLNKHGAMIELWASTTQ